MDPTLLLLRVFFIMTLLGIVRSSKTDSSCHCPPIPKRPLTVDPPDTIDTSYKINSTFRYKCLEGLVRKAGTSNLIRCNADCQWSNTSLKCIQDPLRRDPPQPTATKNIHTSTTSFTEPPSVHSTSSVSTETERTETDTTVPPPQPTSGSFTEPPSVHSTSSVSTETEHAETNTTVPPPQPPSADPLSTTTTLPRTITHSTDPLSSTTTLPRTITHSNTPRTTTSSTTSSTPVTPHSSHSTSTPQLHTKEFWRVHQTISPSNSSQSFDSTLSSHANKDAVVTKMISGVAVGVIALLAVGVAYFFYRRRSRNNIPQGTPEELIAMKPTPSN